MDTVRLPDEVWESHRSLLRARYTIGEELAKQKTRVVMILLSRDFVYREGKNWSSKYWQWVNKIQLLPHEQMALDYHLSHIAFLEVQKKSLNDEIDNLVKLEPYEKLVRYLSTIRGISAYSALLIILELIDFKRFKSPKHLMSFVGLVPSEHPTGKKRRLGGITKEGNGRVRKVLTEAAWTYARKPRTSRYIAKKYQDVPPGVIKIALKAEMRLHKKFYRLLLTGHPKPKAIIAVARELVGFIWAIAIESGDTIPVMEEAGSQAR